MQELEKSFINCLLKNPDWIPKSISKISDDVFSDESSQWFYRTISDHYLKFGTGITKAALKAYLNDTFENKEHEEMLLFARSIANQESIETDFDFYIDRLLNAKNYRSVLSALQDVANSITPANTPAKIDLLEERISRIRSDSKLTVAAETDLSKNVLQRIRQFDKFDEDVKGIPTPIRDLNAVIGGLRKSRVHVIAAPPGEGKSQVLLQFGEYANSYGAGNNVVLYTLEMSYADMEDRYHSLITKMDSKKISNRSFDPAEKREFYKKILLKHTETNQHPDIKKEFSSKTSVELGLEPTEEEVKIYGEKARDRAMDRFVVNFSKYKIRENRFLIVDSPGGISIPKLRMGLKTISTKFPIGLLVIDYINLIKSGIRGLETWDDGKHVAQSLKQIAREYDIPVLTAAQLHLGEKNEKDTKVGQQDMRYSKAITENADYVIAFRRSEKDKLLGIIRLELIKHRHSESKTIAVREKFKSMSIENLVEVGTELDSNEK